MKKSRKGNKYGSDAATWRSWADTNYQGAKILFATGDPFMWFPASILGHHALEMYLKAALIRHGQLGGEGDAWGHDLVKLGRALEGHIGDLPSETIEGLKVFTDYFDELRYPATMEIEGLGAEAFDRLTAIRSTLRPHAIGKPV